MYVIVNALHNLYKNKKRSLVSLLVSVAVFAALLIAVHVWQYADAFIAEQLSNLAQVQAQVSTTQTNEPRLTGSGESLQRNQQRQRIEAYNSLIEPMLRLRQVAVSFVWVVALLGAGIVLMINIMFTNERQAEFGMLRHLGMEKNKLILGIATELGVLKLTALALAVTLASFASEPIVSWLM